MTGYTGTKTLYYLCSGLHSGNPLGLHSGNRLCCAPPHFVALPLAPKNHRAATRLDQKAIQTIQTHPPAGPNTAKSLKMSDGKYKKRARILKLLGIRQPESPAEKNPGQHSRGSGESLAHTPTAAPSVTSVAKTTPSAQTPKSPAPHLTAPGGAIGSPRPNPTSATAVAMDTAHIQVENGPVSTAASSTQAQSLWGRAINSDELFLQERKTLTDVGFGLDSQKMASAIRSMTDGILSEKKGELWKVKLRGGEEVVLRDVGMKILRWVDKFKQIGDIIVQYDPGHAALPWAGFRFLLQVCLSKQENVDTVLVGLEKTAYLIDRCTIYELLYTNGDAVASKNLEKSILRLYTAILKFLAKAIKTLDGG